MIESTPPFRFDRPLFWSLLKLEILEKYSNALAGVIGSQRSVRFVDLMAGEGYYDTGDAGSTGRLAAIAAVHSAAGRPVSCIAYEQHPAAFARLEANTADVRQFVTVRQGRWEDQVEGLLKELVGQFVFFFVDPMGVRQIPWDCLAPLAQRQDTELLINFSSVTAARLAGSALGTSAKAVGHGKALSRVMGGDYWRDAVRDKPRAEAMHTTLTREYVRFIAREGRSSVASVEINEHGATGTPKYHLVFASRHNKAFEIMNDILHLQRERLLRDSTLAVQLPLIDSVSEETYDSQREEQLVRELVTSLSFDSSFQSRIVTVEQLFKFGFISRFAQFKQALYARAATELVHEGRLTVVGPTKYYRGILQRSVQVRFPA